MASLAGNAARCLDKSKSMADNFFLLLLQGYPDMCSLFNGLWHFIIIIIKRRSGINPIPPTVIDRD